MDELGFCLTQKRVGASGVYVSWNVHQNNTHSIAWVWLTRLECPLFHMALTKQRNCTVLQQDRQKIFGFYDKRLMSWHRQHMSANRARKLTDLAGVLCSLQWILSVVASRLAQLYDLCNCILQMCTEKLVPIQNISSCMYAISSYPMHIDTCTKDTSF